jgi:hypothetical protein
MDQGIAPGMKLHKPLLHPVTGKVLLPAGTVLTEGYIDRIGRQGLESFLLECLDMPRPAEALAAGARNKDLDDFEIDIPDVSEMLAEIARAIGMSGGSSAPAVAPPPAPQPVFVPVLPGQPPAPAAYIPTADQPHWVPSGATPAAGPAPAPAPAVPTPPPLPQVVAVAGQTNVQRYYHNPSHFMTERSLMAAMQCVEDMDAQVKAGAAPVYSALARVVQEVIDRLGNNLAALNAGIEVRVVNQPHDRSHPVNVFILSVVIGLAMSYTQEQLLLLGIAALCHDIGKTAIPREILDKVGPLTPQEVDLLRAHTLMGKRIMEKFPWADPLITRIVYEHHERNDGSGYPQKLTDKQIHEMSKIVAVAEVYDALMSDTSYRARYKPEIAYNSIKVGDRTGLDAKVIRAFQRYVVPYPLNSWVTLESGEVAQVVQQNKQNPLKPVIRVGGTNIDLADQHRYSIANSHFRAF